MTEIVVLIVFPVIVASAVMAIIPMPYGLILGAFGCCALWIWREKNIIEGLPGGMIVTILALATAPLMQEEITKSHYCAQVIPIIGTLRTQALLYQYAHGRILGTTLLAACDVVSNCETTVSAQEEIMAEVPGSWMELVAVTNESRTVEWNPALLDVGGRTVEVPDHRQADAHFMRELGISVNDLSISRTDPGGYVYGVAGDGTNRYAFVWGYFGAGGKGKLPIGTGYAVLEAVNGSHKSKLVAVWKDFRKEDARIVPGFVSLRELPLDKDKKAWQSLAATRCLVPLELLSGDSTLQVAAEAAMERLGWEL